MGRSGGEKTNRKKNRTLRKKQERTRQMSGINREGREGINEGNEKFYMSHMTSCYYVTKVPHLGHMMTSGLGPFCC